MEYLVQPWKHQLEAIEKATAPGVKEFAFLFEMGSGKTGASINTIRAVLTRIGSMQNVLIICPVVVCNNWLAEIRMHSKMGDRVTVLTGPGPSRKKKLLELIESKTPRIIVTNYECLAIQGMQELFLRWRPRIVLADEAHRVKKCLREGISGSIRNVGRRCFPSLSAIWRSLYSIRAGFQK